MQILLIALTALVLLVSPVKVRGQSCAQGATANALFFVNGVWNPTYASARQSAYALERLKGELGAAGTIDVRLAYNPGDGYLSDLVEAAGQRYGVSTDWSLFSLWVAGEVIPAAAEAAFTRDIGLSTITKFLPPRTTSSVLQEHVSLYRAALCRGQKVILVAHSQGNFFANAALESSEGLTPPEAAGVTIISVANPDDHTARASSLTSPVTLVEDKVISLVPSAMRAAYSNPPTDASNGDASKHQFVLSYLQEGYDGSVPRDGPLNSRRAIKDRIAALVTPPRQATVVYSVSGTSESVELAPPGGLRYYFLGYQSAGTPPTQPGFWLATQSFDVVRVRLIGGTGRCEDLAPDLFSASRLIDDAGQTISTLSGGGSSVPGYCVFRANVPAGARIAAIELNPGLLSDKTFVFAGSSQNSGRTLSGFGVEGTGGLAFQFCSGLCTEPLGSSGSTARPLPDTGITTNQCLEAGSVTLVSCASEGALALNNRQDGMVGRDVTQADSSDGRGGFSFSLVPKAGGGNYDRTECVKDNITGLTWEGKTNDGGLRDASRTFTNDSGGQAGSALEFVAYVNSIGLCGYADWRIPSINELLSIVDYGVPNPGATIDTTWLPSSTWFHWTSTQVFNRSDLKFLVWFTTGQSANGSVGGRYELRLVRGGTETLQQRFTLTSNGSEVGDNQTGLTWRRCSEGQSSVNSGCEGTETLFNHEDALRYAQSQAGWRLPNVKELASIVDVSRASPAVDVAAFPRTPSFQFWSSSPYASGGSNAWTVDFDAGYVSPQAREGVRAIRLVRQ
jgi:hypothetical protein